MEKIRVSVRTKDLLAIHFLENLQGSLKTLSEESYQRLKNEIITDGFSFSVHVYEDPESSKIYIIDGHQRVAAMKRMKDEGFEIPQIPVTFVEADNLDHAKKKVLAAASQYGEFNQKGAEDFISSIAGINMDYLKQNIQMPFLNFDMMNLSEQILVNAHMRDKTDPNAEWVEMPEFNQEDKMPYRTVMIHFKENKDVEEFEKLMGQTITDKTKSLWFPKQVNMETEAKRYILRKSEDESEQ